MIRRRRRSRLTNGPQVEPFAPYPLLDFTVGLFDAKESWLAPRGAWDLLENAHAFRGRIAKRRGYKLLAALCQDVTDEARGATAVQSVYSGTLDNAPVCLPASTYRATFTTDDSTAQTAYANAQRVGTGTAAVSGEQASTNPGLQAGVSFTASNTPIVPGSLVIRDANGTIVGNDLGNGKIDGAVVIFSMFFSSIDYATGAAFSLFDTSRLGPFTIDYQYVTGQQGEVLLQDVGPTNVGLPPTPTWGPIYAKPIFPGTFHLEDSGGLVVNDDGLGNLTGDAGVAGTIDYATSTLSGFALPTGWSGIQSVSATLEVGFLEHSTGDYEIDWFVPTAAGGDLTASYGFNAQRPVMGIANFFDRLGNEYTVACDTRRLYRYNSARAHFVDVAATDLFTGTDSDFFVMEPFEDALVLCNGVDPPKQYTPLGAAPYVSNMGRDFDGDTVDELDTALIFLRGKDNSGVYLNTRESGTNYPQRARFTQVNDIQFASATAATAELYSDAPTGDEIIGAAPLGDDFVVAFRRSFWLLRYVGDPLAPYDWERIPSTDGGVARKALVEFAEEVIARGQTGVVSIDGLGENPLDVEVPDIALGWNPSKAHYSQAHHSREARQIILSYADAEDVPDKALIIQYDDKRTQRTFARYDFPFHAIGEYRRQASILWDDLDQLLDSYTFVLDDVSNEAGFPIVLVGDRAGQVHEWGLVNDDNGAPIRAVMRSTRLNPFPLRQAHLGYIDLLLGYQPGHVLTVNVYADFSSSPYFSASVDTEGTATASDGKVKRRVPVNKIANWHAIEIVEESTAPLQVDAVVPYFRAAGLMHDVAP